MHCRISPRITCNPCGHTKKIILRYHRLLIYDVKRTTKIDGMGPFKFIEDSLISTEAMFSLGATWNHSCLGMALFDKDAVE